MAHILNIRAENETIGQISTMKRCKKFRKKTVFLRFFCGQKAAVMIGDENLLTLSKL